MFGNGNVITNVLVHLLLLMRTHAQLLAMYSYSSITNVLVLVLMKMYLVPRSAVGYGLYIMTM